MTVVEAADLIAISGVAYGKSDPFCSVQLGEVQEKCTEVRNATLSPVWNNKVCGIEGGRLVSISALLS